MHLRAILHEIPQPFIITFILRSSFLRFHSNLPANNELTWCNNRKQLLISEDIFYVSVILLVPNLRHTSATCTGSVCVDTEIDFYKYMFLSGKWYTIRLFSLHELFRLLWYGIIVLLSTVSRGCENGNITCISMMFGFYASTKHDGAHLGPTGPWWPPCWPYELC